MLRFIKHNLTSILDVEWYPIFSLLLFTTFFALVIVRVIKMSKETVDEVSDLPLTDSLEKITKD
jgi:cytochrome c oxidase cbb3-type subunit IV